MKANVIKIKEEDQPSQGGLIVNELSYETVEEKIEEINVFSIKPFTIIPDYVVPTDSKYPFVVKTPSSANCIDGWNLVEKAIGDGKEVITCKVEYIAEHSDEELAIRKVAIRVKPKGGFGSYSETVRNTKCLEKILLNSGRDLKLFQHGGDRKGEGFINNRQDNVVKVLSFRLAKSETTINQYLNYARFLNQETLNFLAAQGVGKDFFEKAQTNKRVQIDRMIVEGKFDADITIQISKDMRKWHEEYRLNNKIKPILSTQGIEAEPENVTPELETELETPEETMPKVIIPEVLDSWYGSPSGDEEESFENIISDVEASAQRLLEAVTRARSTADRDQFKQHITEEVRYLSLIPFRLSVLITTGIREDSCQEEVLQ
jgi:hypothetical protein